VRLDTGEFHRQAVGGGRDRPPLLPFGLAVGITGHRSEAIPADEADALADRIRSALELLLSEALAVRSCSAEYFSSDKPRLAFVSPLADGADQLAAEIALDLGYELHAVLPFTLERTREDMPDDAARERLDSLLARSSSMLELPGDDTDEAGAYVMAGRATVAHSDVLIAVWDGEPARGRGGTGEVVRLAFERAKPVIHIPTRANAPVRALWGAFDPVLVAHFDDPAAARTFDPHLAREIVNALLAPPADDRERNFIRLFQNERRRILRPRIEYPLLLAVAGVARFKRHHWRDASIAWTQAEWQEFRDACEHAGALVPPIGTLQLWYEWADSLAGHFAQSHRSGHVFNFFLGAIAVLLGVANLVLPSRWSVFLEVSLFLVVLAILANTWAANRGEWHRRWLDYRQLAERLRPMRSLKLLGVAAPSSPGTAANPLAERWVEWHAATVWRALGCPSGRMSASQLGALTRSIAEKEIEPQVSYHRKAAEKALRLDYRLEVFGTFVFALALLSSVVLLTGFLFAPEWVAENYNWFTVLSAGLPAIGTAVAGIRLQGDHGASAARSQHTSLVLDKVRLRLQGEERNLLRAADLAEQAAQTMLSDLNEWKLLAQQRGLSVG
jgi:hypothetical protein